MILSLWRRQCFSLRSSGRRRRRDQRRLCRAPPELQQPAQSHEARDRPVRSAEAAALLQVRHCLVFPPPFLDLPLPFHCFYLTFHCLQVPVQEGLQRVQRFGSRRHARIELRVRVHRASVRGVHGRLRAVSQGLRRMRRDRQRLVSAVLRDCPGGECATSCLSLPFAALPRWRSRWFLCRPFADEAVAITGGGVPGPALHHDALQ